MATQNLSSYRQESNSNNTPALKTRPPLYRDGQEIRRGIHNINEELWDVISDAHAYTELCIEEAHKFFSHPERQSNVANMTDMHIRKQFEAMSSVAEAMRRTGLAVFEMMSTMAESAPFLVKSSGSDQVYIGAVKTVKGE